MTTHIMKKQIGYREAIMYPNNRMNALPRISRSERELIVSGEGEVFAKPDTAVLQFGVVTQNKDASKAQKENEEIMKNLIRSLYTLSISENDLQTVSYNVRPLYQYEEGNPPKIVGYEVMNMLQVSTSKLNMIGQLMETAAENGANRIENPRFELKDATRYEKKAYQLAIRDSLMKAKTISKGYGTTIVMPPIKIEERDQIVSTLRQPMSLQASEAVLFPKELTIRVQLLVHFFYQ